MKFVFLERPGLHPIEVSRLRTKTNVLRMRSTIVRAWGKWIQVSAVEVGGEAASAYNGAVADAGRSSVAVVKTEPVVKTELVCAVKEPQ